MPARLWVVKNSAIFNYGANCSGNASEGLWLGFQQSLEITALVRWCLPNYSLSCNGKVHLRGYSKVITEQDFLNYLLRMRQIDIHRQCNCQTSNRHRLRRQWKREGQPNQQQIQYAEKCEKAIPVRQGAWEVKVGLLDFAPCQPVRHKRHQGRQQKRPPRQHQEKPAHGLINAVPNHLDSLGDEGEQAVPTHILKPQGMLAFLLAGDESGTPSPWHRFWQTAGRSSVWQCCGLPFQGRTQSWHPRFAGRSSANYRTPRPQPARPPAARSSGSTGSNSHYEANRWNIDRHSCREAGIQSHGRETRICHRCPINHLCNRRITLHGTGFRQSMPEWRRLSHNENCCSTGGYAASRVHSGPVSLNGWLPKASRRLAGTSRCTHSLSPSSADSVGNWLFNPETSVSTNIRNLTRSDSFSLSTEER